MNCLIRPLILGLSLTLAVPAFAAKPGKASKKVEPTAAKLEVELAHSFGQSAEAELAKLVERFNSQNPAGTVKLVRQGSGGKPAPLNILRRTQVAEFVANKESFKPLYGVMKDAKEPFDASALSKDLRAGVVDEKGRIIALPVAYSTAVLFYNRNAFRKAKLDPDKAPGTWQEMQEVAGKLQAAGYDCPYTTSWPTWVHIDNVSALADSPVATAKGDLVFNGFVEVKHIAKLSTWKKAGYFHVFGRTNEGDAKFKSGECVMLTTDSSAHADFLEAQGVELGVAPLPYHDDGYGGRQHTLADGASLWVGAGYKPAEYKAVAKFVHFLLTPEIQVQLAAVYGQLPLTQAARVALKSKVLKNHAQTMEVAYASMKGEGSASPLRISAIDPVRIIIDEELEKVWEGKIPPKEALDTAAARGNAVLKAKPALRRATPF